ncbi:uncharacterized protein LOC133824323 [Humulus lupulus]|uniref:uncharacterized protein LOC133824323 n=1 Tax=Humulus lupulus TaxID=3486 RepID=UPI002B40F0D1|nr:uncharacterized protein LOC133824323 [Humulus lupulus]
MEGRILLVWKADQVSLSILQEDDQYIHCFVKIKGVIQKFCLTLVYGRNSVEERKSLWTQLSLLEFPVLPWLVVGDFNAVFYYDDRIGGRPITEMELEDGHHWRVCFMLAKLRSSGSHYTCSNKQMEGTRIFFKLDRVFNNEAWIDDFPDSEARINWDVISDHCYCFIKTVPIQILGTRPFKYFNMWADHQDFRNTVLCNWSKPIASSGSQQIVKKLKRLKPVLLQFNKVKVGDVAKKISEAKIKYQQARLYLQEDPSSISLQQAEKEACLEFGCQSRMYESFLRQRSKITWLRFGDENTPYFHASLKQRKLGNRITSFMDDAVLTRIEQECFSQGVVLNLEQQLGLIMPFTKKDVKKSLFSIHSIKSPDPDGYGSGFYKSLWKDIGDEILEAILTFFDRGELPHELNNTIISLIPKLAKVLPMIVHQNQGAFIQNCLLAHNILILQDLLKGYTRKNVSPHCLIKIYLSKAYDSLDWVFLEDILKGFCFPSRFIQWIMTCLTGTSYTLLMNGRFQGGFGGRKGLRQGDSISPLLFVLAMEYLTHLIILVTHDKEFRLHPMCKSLHLFNLCFEDDLILFCKGNLRSMQILFDGFTKFSQDFGFSANLTKSQVYFGGISAKEKNSIMNYVNIEEGYFPLKYLGVTLQPTKWKAADFGVIIKKIQNRLHTWSSHHLPFAGISQLTHSVLLGIRTYWMSILLLPQSVIHEIDRLCQTFLWGAKGNRSKLHYSSWEQVCLPKNMGGIDLEASSFNGKLNLKFLYSHLLQRGSVSFAKGVWFKISVPKHRFILWQSVLGHLLTRDNLLHCHVPMVSTLCPVCERVDESHAHLFFECLFSQKFLVLIKRWLGPALWPVKYTEWLYWIEGKPKGMLQRIDVASLAAVVYCIWFNRNSCIFAHCSLSAHRIDRMIRLCLKARLFSITSQKLQVKEKFLVDFVRNL